MKKMIRVKLILLLIGTTFLTGCRLMRNVTYDGDYPELFSIAVQSLLGVRGYEEGHLSLPDIRTISEDNYGRVMFSYREDRVSSYLIIQKVDGDYAYFYPHYNFILTSSEQGWEFSDENVDALKIANNWNQPMSDRSDFERVPIIRLKEDGPISDELLIETFFEMFPDVELRPARMAASRFRFLRTDRYGRSIYLTAERGVGWGGPYFVVMFQPNHSFDLETDTLEIRDMNNYQTQLRLFMEANGWNETWEGDEE